MKTASFPSVQVEPELRQTAEDHLLEGETIESFVELAIREKVECRRSHQELIDAALASREEARITGEYTPAVTVSDQLLLIFAKAKVKAGT